MLAKRALQFAVAIGGCVPVVAGFTGIAQGAFMIGGVNSLPVSADSHFRYLSGLLLGIGLAYWSTIPDIEKKGARFRLLTTIVVTGGLGRLLSLLTLGMPEKPMLFGLIMELVVTPLMALGQYSLEKKMAGTQ